MAQGRSFIQSGRQAYRENATDRSLNAQPVRAVRQLQHGQAGSLKVHCPQKILDNSWASERHQRDMGLQRDNEHTARNETTSGYVPALGYVPAAGPVLEFARTEPVRLCMSVLPWSGTA